MNHGELKTAIADYMQRSDLTADIPGFIQRAEQRIGRFLRIDENQLEATVTPVSGTVALPARFVEMTRVTTGTGTALRILRPVTKNASRRYPATGDAQAYYIAAGQIYTLPPADDDLDLIYFEYPEPLAGELDSVTRPVLDRYEHLYLDGALCEGALFVRDMESRTAFEQRFRDGINAANAAFQQRYDLSPTAPYFSPSPVVGH